MPAAIDDVKVEISVVLGFSRLQISQLLRIGRGAVIELDRTVTDHSLVLANGRPIASGEVVVVGENVAISIAKLLSGTHSLHTTS